MAFTDVFTSLEPARADIDATTGLLVLEFGTGWCGFCRGAQPHIAAAFSDHPDVLHRKIEDGAGRRLGRSFKVKLWPTLVFLKDGVEVARVVRPNSSQTVTDALDSLKA